MKNPFKTNNPKRHRNDLKRPQMTSKDANENNKSVFKNQMQKNSLRGGDPNDVNLVMEAFLMNRLFLFQ